MSDPQAGPSKINETMTLSEYLSLPENQDASLVMPLSWCPHLEENVDVLTQNLNMVDFDVKRKCENCDNVGENWICLICHQVYCSRYVKEHMVVHSTEHQHVLALSFSDLSVWCYGCEDYVDNELLYPVKNALHQNKFDGEAMPRKEIVLNMSQ